MMSSVLRVAEGSIRLGILKVRQSKCVSASFIGCRGLDPIGDTERGLERAESRAAVSCRGLDPIGDTERLQRDSMYIRRISCRGLDPIGDTESLTHLHAASHTEDVAEGSIRLGILKVDFRDDLADSSFLLQRARSDWGY